MDINELASLLHLEEKLRGHPQWQNLYKAVTQEINKVEKAHKPPQPAPEPAPEPTEEAPPLEIDPNAPKEPTDA